MVSENARGDFIHNLRLKVYMYEKKKKNILTFGKPFCFFFLSECALALKKKEKKNFFFHFFIFFQTSAASVHTFKIFYRLYSFFLYNAGLLYRLRFEKGKKEKKVLAWEFYYIFYQCNGVPKKGVEKKVMEGTGLLKKIQKKFQINSWARKKFNKKKKIQENKWVKAKIWKKVFG